MNQLWENRGEVLCIRWGERDLVRDIGKEEYCVLDTKRMLSQVVEVGCCVSG